MRSAEEMDQADVELRETILKVWSFAARSKIDLLVPKTSEIGRGRLTVGKIYGGLLILENWKTSRFGARLPPPGAKDRGQMMVRGHWEGNRYVGDLDRPQHQLDQDFLELRATTNPYHRAAQPQDRRVGQHFPLATRRIGPSVSRSPSPSQTPRERLLLLPESGDDLYTEWVPQPHGSWNQPSWQDPGQLAPPPDSDAQWLKDTAPLEQFTKEPEGSACLREVSRTPSPSPSIRRPTGRRLPPTPSEPSLLSLAPSLTAPEVTSSPLHLQINFPRLDYSPSRTPGLPAIRLPSMIPSSRPSDQSWRPLGPFHRLEQRLPHIQPLLLSAFDQAVQAGRGQRQLPAMPRIQGALPGTLLPPPSLGHSPSRRVVEDDDEDWC